MEVVGEKGQDSGYILKKGPTGFVNGSEMESERKRGIKVISRVNTSPFYNLVQVLYTS